MTHRSNTRYAIRDCAEENGWELEWSKDEPYFIDGFRDPVTGDTVRVSYAPKSRRIKAVHFSEKIVPSGGMQTTSWEKDTRDKKQLVYNLLFRCAVVRREIAEHWTYDINSWWSVHRAKISVPV